MCAPGECFCAREFRQLLYVHTEMYVTIYIQALHVVPTRRHVGNHGQERVSRRVSVNYKRDDVEGRVYIQVAAEAVAERRNERRRRIDEEGDTPRRERGYAK